MIRHRLAPSVAAGIFLACSTSAFALNPALDITQYAHAAWKISDGVFKAGVIFDVTQTPDGYLWVATDSGVIRFDGVRSVPWQPPAGTRLPSTDVRALRVGRDGRLWIGTVRGIASWKDGALTRYPEIDGQIVEALAEDREGTIWIGTSTPSAGRLCSIQSGTTECHDNGGRFRRGVTAVYEDRSGHLWAGADAGLWRWRPGPPTVYAVPDPDNRINALIESDDGALLVAKKTGFSKLVNGKLEPFPLPPGVEFQPASLLRDRDGALWIGAVVDGGLLHFHNGRIDRYSRSDGLSGNSVPALFEDREGNIWAATADGLDRFRELAVMTIDVEEGLSSHSVSSVVASKDGTIWIATSGGLNKWKNGEVIVYRKRSRLSRSPVASGAGGAFGSAPVVHTIIDAALPADSLESVFEDRRGQLWVTSRSGVAVLRSDRFVAVPSMPHGMVFSIAEDAEGTVWFSHEQGLFGLRDTQVVEHIAWATLGRRARASVLLGDHRQNTLWMGFREGGVARYEHRRLTATYPTGEMVTALHSDGKGRLWAATEDGLRRIAEGQPATLGRANGLPCSTTHWMTEDAAGSVWLYTACGLVRIKPSDFDAWASQPASKIQATVFDTVDGVRSQQFRYGYSGLVAKAPDGRLWFLPHGGLSVIDPARLPSNPLAPPVHVEQVTADDKIYAAIDGLRLPPRIRNLAIDYTALSFVAPEKVRFRYKLEGQNRNWHEVVNDRQVQYTNLAPGNYRFRVMASNNSGVWNETGASLEFSIAPAYYQTRWFAALVAIAAASLLWAAYRLRVAQLARQFNRTLDARVSERTRIARDLHDTLLQSFHGALLRFQAVAKTLPPGADEARARLDLALDQAEAAVTEGRDAVRGLRASATTLNDLANGIAAIGAELTGDPTVVEPPAIAVEVDRPSRNLNPLVRDEAYRIAGEALRNAVRHARARHVVVTIHYEPRQLRLTVVDDGQGVDAQTMARQEVAGHRNSGQIRVWNQWVGHLADVGLCGIADNAELEEFPYTGILRVA